MASLFAKPCVDLAVDCEGYRSDGLYNMYAERLDECDFFAGCGKKNGAVDYCGIAFCYWLFMNVITDDGDVTDDDRKYMTHYAMYQSDSCCTSAGCTQQSDVYKENDAWYTNPQDLERGDQIFFQKSNGQIYHTGMCTGWNEDGCFVTEANVEGRQTLTRFYAYSEFGNKIAGFGRPRYDGWEAASSSDDTTPDPEPTPAPEPSPAPSDDFPYTYRVVNVNSFLRVRSEPNTYSEIIGKLYNGDEVYVWGFEDGWAKVDETKEQWCSLDYLEKV